MSGEHSEFPVGPTQVVKGEVAEEEDDYEAELPPTPESVIAELSKEFPTAGPVIGTPQQLLRNVNYGFSAILAVVAGTLLYEYAQLFLPYDFGGNKGVRVTDKAREKAEAEAAAAEHSDDDAHDDESAADADTASDHNEDETDADAEEEAEAE